MWLLENTFLENQTFCLLANQQYQVGRKDCPILLSNDQSISRKHAVLTVSHTDHQPRDLTRLPEISLQDSSKYGTFLNGKKVGGDPVTLKEGDEVHFGQNNHKFRVKALKFVIATSCVNDGETKKNIKAWISKIDGHISNEWRSECTHLIMEKLTFTIKVVCALACGCPVVTPKYLQALMAVVENPSKSLPKEESYFPDILEPSLKSCKEQLIPSPERKSTFSGKQFLFLSKKQHKRLHMAIELAGGTTQLKDHHDDVVLDLLQFDDVLVIEPESRDKVSASDVQKIWIQTLVENLESHNLRPIKESEVGLAILYKSLQIYCNPKSSGGISSQATNSQVLQETFAASESQGTETTLNQIDKKDLQINKRTLVNTDPYPLFKKPQVLIQESQLEVEKKRKRSSNGSTHIVEESIYQGETSKRQRRTSSDESNSYVSNVEKNPPDMISDTSGEEADDPFALDTEFSSTNRKSSRKGSGDTCSSKNKSRILETQMTESSVLPNIAVKTEKLDESKVIETDRKEHVDSVTSKERRRSRVEETQMTESLVILNKAVKKENTNNQRNEGDQDDIVDSATGKERRRNHVEETPLPETVASSERNIKKENIDDSETARNDNQSSCGGDFLIQKKLSRSRVEDTQLSEATASSVQIVKKETDSRNDSRPKQVAVTKRLEKSRIEESEMSEYLACSEHFIKAEKSDDVPDRSKQDSSFSAAVVSFENQHQNGSERSVRSNAKTYELMAKISKDEIPYGFLSTVAELPPPPKTERDPDLEDIPDDLVVTHVTSLVVRARVVKTVATNPLANEISSVKNFKRFKKSSHPGQNQVIPKIIGGRDLVVYHGEDNERDQLFAELREEDEKQEKDEQFIDALFNWETDKRPRKR